MNNKLKGQILAVAGLFMIMVNALIFLSSESNQFIFGTIGFLFLIIGINTYKKDKKTFSKKKQILLIIVAIIITLGILFLFVNYQENKNDTTTPITEEEAIAIAEQRIKQDYNYNDLNGYDLRLIATPLRCGDNCIEVIYEYKVNQTKVTNLDRIQTKLIIEGPRTRNMTYSEITKSEKHILKVTDFQSCVGAGYEVLYPECESCIPYCETPDGMAYSKNLDSSTPTNICIDKCGDGICNEIVCQGEDCPCHETRESCKIDCAE